MTRKVAIIVAATAIIIAALMVDWRAIRMWTYKRELAIAWNEVVTLGPTNSNQSDVIARTDKYRDLLTKHGHFKYGEFSVSLTARNYDRERRRGRFGRFESTSL